MGLNSFMRSVAGAFIKSPQDARNIDLGPVIPVGCPVLTDCTLWPPGAVLFTLTGLVSTLTPTNGTVNDPACCYQEFGGLYSYRIHNLVECLNKTWRVGYSSGDLLLNSETQRVCRDIYGLRCIINNIPDTTPEGGGEPHKFDLLILIEVISTKNLITGLIESVTISLKILYGFQHYFFGLLRGNCDSLALYSHTFIGFTCNGPWTLERDDLNTSTNINWPATIDLSADYVPIGTVPIYSNSCCADLFTTRCQPASWNCIFGSCVDPVDGSGTYLILTDCQIPCAVTQSFNCIGGNNCIDPGDGSGTYPNRPACEAVCVTPTHSWECVDHFCLELNNNSGTFTSLADCNNSNCADGPDTRPLCCPEGVPANQFVCEIDVHGTDCNCVDEITNPVWIGGRNAYIAEYFECGTFMELKIACDPDTQTWRLQLRCGGSLGDLLIDTEVGSLCNLGAISFIILTTTLPTDCCATVHDVELNFYV